MEIPLAAYSCSRGDFMVETHELSLNGQTVGTVYIKRRGLYYHITCRCKLPSVGMYRIKAFSETAETDLGICIPMGTHFGIETNLPVSRLGEGELTFQIVAKNQEAASRFVPIDPETPFAYISKLEKARLSYRDGIPGVMIAE